jgi:hypothetical protein
VPASIASCNASGDVSPCHNAEVTDEGSGTAWAHVSSVGVACALDSDDVPAALKSAARKSASATGASLNVQTCQSSRPSQPDT